jgi:ribosomal protein L24
MSAAGCGSVPTAPERVFNVGDFVKIVSGDLAGLTGRITTADAARQWYTVDFESTVQARRFFWNQLQSLQSFTATFKEGDRVIVTNGALSGKTGKIIRVYDPFDDYTIQLDDGVQAGRFSANQLKSWTQEAIVKDQIKTAAVVSFTGPDIDADSGETFAWHLANVPDISKKYKMSPVTPNIQKKRHDEKLLNYNSVYYSEALAISEQLDTDYVFTGYVCRLGRQNIVLIVMLDGKTGRLVAGDYKSFLNTQQIPAQFPAMVKKIISAADKNTAAEKPAVAVRTIAVSNTGIEAADANILSNLLAADIANSGVFAIFPRDALKELQAAREAAALDTDGAVVEETGLVDKTTLTKTDFVLSGKIAMFNTKNQFLAEVIGVESNILIAGASIDFGTVEDAFGKIRQLAGSLTTAR